jgi:hypothetical protein
VLLLLGCDSAEEGPAAVAVAAGRTTVVFTGVLAELDEEPPSEGSVRALGIRDKNRIPVTPQWIMQSNSMMYALLNVIWSGIESEWTSSARKKTKRKSHRDKDFYRIIWVNTTCCFINDNVLRSHDAVDGIGGQELVYLVHQIHLIIVARWCLLFHKGREQQIEF